MKQFIINEKRGVFYFKFENVTNVDCGLIALLRVALAENLSN